MGWSHPKSDVILNGGEAGMRDRTCAYSAAGVDGVVYGASSVVVLSTAWVMHGDVRSLGGLRPSQDDIKRESRIAVSGANAAS